MERPLDQRVTAEIAREVCLRTGGKAMVAGTISKLGSHYAIQLKASNCESGDLLAVTEAEAENPEKALHALHQAGSELRRKLGESLLSLQKFNTPLEAATTSSLEALRAYSDGFRIWHQTGTPEAFPLMKRALQFDPEFARAYDALCTMYSNLGEASQSAENCRKAFDLRDRASKREKYKIMADYYGNVTGEQDKALEQYGLWLHDYPRDTSALNDMAVVLLNFGHLDKGAARLRNAIEQHPGNVNIYTNLAWANINLGRAEEAKAVIQEALNRKLDDPGLRASAYTLAFFLGDETGMEQQLSIASGRLEFEEVLLGLDSDTQAYFGRVKKARIVSEQAAQSALRNGHKEVAALGLAHRAVREAQFGNQTEAIRVAKLSLAQAPGHDVRANAALALAVAGHAAEAKRSADELNRAYPWTR